MKLRLPAIQEAVFFQHSLGYLFPMNELNVGQSLPPGGGRGGGGGGTLGISGWGCAAGTLEPLAYTRASSAEFCYPTLE